MQDCCPEEMREMVGTGDRGRETEGKRKKEGEAETDGETEAKRRHTHTHTQRRSSGSGQCYQSKQECLLLGEAVKPIQVPQIFETVQPTSKGRVLASSYVAARRLAGY